MAEINDEQQVELDEVYQEIAEFVAGLTVDYDPMIVAGAMMGLSLQLYKTALEPEEFNMIVDTISDSRDRVQSLQVPKLQ